MFFKEELRRKCLKLFLILDAFLIIGILVWGVLSIHLMDKDFKKELAQVAEILPARAATTFTVNTSISVANTTFDNDDITCDGAITLTIDGAHPFASLALINGCTLTHSISTTTTINKLNLTIAGTLSVCSTCTIDVTGRGFLGGSNGGATNLGRTSNGAGGQQDGTGPANAGSHGGLGGRQSTALAKNAAYDSIVNPSEPGGGGGNASLNDGNDGGGVVLITVGTLTLNGTIKADGESVTQKCGGAGGTIRIIATTVQGSGSIQAKGGLSASVGACNNFGAERVSGGGGRIVVKYA
ncbi:MAG: fibronectin type III domain-containing protein, partial [Parcubacteria group bacterium Greene0416_36]